MATEQMNLVGLKCPQPVLKVSMRAAQLKAGDIIEATADCSTFESDIRAWCQRSNKVLLFVKDLGGKKIAQIQI